MDTDLRGHDPGRWGHSLANLGEIVTAILDAAGVRSIVELGTYEGDLTRVILEWGGSDVRVTAVEPDPPARLLRLLRERPELELVRETSHEALKGVDVPDALIIDGDHNYYTVREELRLIAERSDEENLPLLLLHDVGWPHARRDAYYDPDRIPVEHRQPTVRGAILFPGEEGLAEGGLPYRWAAEREGGPRNGVLTALEDFLADRDDLELAIVPAFFGLAVAWRREAPWAEAVAAAVAPWDRNPVLARLESNRVYLLASEYTRRAELWRLEQRIAGYEHMLRSLLESSAFALADRLATLRARGRGVPWREQVRDLLDGHSGSG
jgi:Methyltransferase domain